MKTKTLSIFAVVIALYACTSKNTSQTSQVLQLNGTWKLISGTTITKGVSTVTDYTKTQEMIKVINGTHFAFLKHPLHSDTAKVNSFDAGGGRYTLTGNHYTEHLDYYSDKNWEGKTFEFTVNIKNDTLIQRGIEKVVNEGIDREIIEKYIKIK